MKMRIVVYGLFLMAGMAVNAEAGNALKPVNAGKFDALATAALEAMKQKAAELKVSGAAVANYAPGEAVEGWSSKMAVVGRMTVPPEEAGKGNNLLAIAYAKSAEMARTLVNSGTATGPIMTGEFGWQGGVVEQVKGGWVIVSFSGGKPEDDVQDLKAGLAVMKSRL